MNVLFTLEGVRTLEEAIERVAEMEKKLHEISQVSRQLSELSYEDLLSPSWLIALANFQETLGVDDAAITEGRRLSVERWRELKTGTSAAMFPEYDELLMFKDSLSRRSTNRFWAWIRAAEKVDKYRR